MTAPNATSRRPWYFHWAFDAIIVATVMFGGALFFLLTVGQGFFK